MTAGFPFKVGKVGEGGTVDAGNHSDDGFGDRHHGAGVAGGDKAVGVAIADQTGCDADAGIPFGSESLGRIVLHGDHFAGVDDADGQVSPAVVLGQLGFEDVLFPDKDQVDVLVARSANCAVNLGSGRVIATHCIDSDGYHAEGQDRLFGDDFDDFAALIIAAVRAGAMGELHFVALGAFGEARSLQRVMSPALGRATIAMASFGIGHSNFLGSGPAVADRRRHETSLL